MDHNNWCTCSLSRICWYTAEDGVMFQPELPPAGQDKSAAWNKDPAVKLSYQLSSGHIN